MRNILEALIVGALLFTLVSPAGTTAGSENEGSESGSRSLKVGLGVRVDSDWISLNGTWSISETDRSTNAEQSAARTHEIRIGAFPNLVQKALTGCVLIRAIRTATFCAARHLYAGQTGAGNRTEGK
jgi:hypothetical protein